MLLTSLNSDGFSCLVSTFLTPLKWHTGLLWFSVATLSFQGARSDCPFSRPGAGSSITAGPPSIIMLSSSFFSLTFSLDYLVFLTTPLCIASFLIHPPQIPRAPTLLIYFKFLKYPLLVYIRLRTFMFPLPNKLLAILIVAERCHPRRSVYQCLRAAFLALSP